MAICIGIERSCREMMRLIQSERFHSGQRSALNDPTADTALLPFCKLAVERMGGRIALTGRPGKTVFAVTLPAGATAAS